MFSSARDLIGKHRREQILALHALQLRRHLAAADEARQRERRGCVPAPAHAEHRRVEQRLDQHVARGVRMQVARDVVERKTVARRQRQDDRILGRRRLQLEIERAAESLAQREAPRAIDAAAERRMDDELHAARLVEEALHRELVLASAARRARLSRRRDIRRSGARRLRRRPRSRISHAVVSVRPSSRCARNLLAQSRHGECDSSSLRPGASPSQNGIVGGAPCASSTRTRPRSTRRMRYDMLPSWKMSPAMLSTAKSSLTVPTIVACGSSTTS